MKARPCIGNDFLQKNPTKVHPPEQPHNRYRLSIPQLNKSRGYCSRTYKALAPPISTVLAYSLISTLDPLRLAAKGVRGSLVSRVITLITTTVSI